MKTYSGDMDKIDEANLNMPKLSTPFSHKRSPIKPKRGNKKAMKTKIKS